MRIILVFLLLIIFNVKTFSQENGVPFRVGNKFGISDKNGMLIIKPEYDYIFINLEKDKAYFQAFTKIDTNVTSSFIFKNKLLISNKDYSDYHIDSNFIIATKYLLKKNLQSNQIQKKGEINYLYDFRGKKIFEEGFAIISIIEDFESSNFVHESKKNLNEVLIITKDVSEKYSIVVYDKVLEKVSHAFLNKVPFLNVNYNYENIATDKTITCVYEDETGKGKKIRLKIEKNHFKIFANEAVDISKKNNQPSRTNNYDIVVDDEIVSVPFKNPDAENNYEGNEQKKILKVNKIEIKKDVYYAPVKNEEIESSDESLNENERYIVSSKRKAGFFYVHGNSLLIPIKYDEIMLDGSSKDRAAFILKNQNKYGLFVYDAPNHKIIEPVFDKIPLLFDYNYFGKGQPLIKLFDENGKFFCYSNQEGKLFYSEK